MHSTNLLVVPLALAISGVSLAQDVEPLSPPHSPPG